MEIHDFLTIFSYSITINLTASTLVNDPLIFWSLCILVVNKWFALVQKIIPIDPLSRLPPFENNITFPIIPLVFFFSINMRFQNIRSHNLKGWKLHQFPTSGKILITHWISQWVYNILHSVYLLQQHFPILHHISHKMVFYINVMYLNDIVFSLLGVLHFKFHNTSWQHANQIQPINTIYATK